MALSALSHRQTRSVFGFVRLDKGVVDMENDRTNLAPCFTEHKWPEELELWLVHSDRQFMRVEISFRGTVRGIALLDNLASSPDDWQVTDTSTWNVSCMMDFPACVDYICNTHMLYV